VVYLRVAQYREPHRKQLDTSRRRLGHGLVGPNKDHALDGGPNPPWEGDFFGGAYTGTCLGMHAVYIVNDIRSAACGGAASRYH